MIGAHTPKPIPARRTRCLLNETARLINRAYDEKFVRGAQRAHLVYQPLPPK